MMSKLDELIARWDGETGERIWDTESFADECIAELRRLQVRERRYRELEERYDRAGGLLGAVADDLRAILEET